MSDTTMQECIKCGYETDCIEGICQECALKQQPTAGELRVALEQSKEIFSRKLRELREKQETAQENLAFVERRYWSGVHTQVFELRHEIEHKLDELNLNEFCIQMAFMPKEKREATIAKAKKEGKNER